MVTEMIKPGLLDWSTLVERMACAPARVAGIETGTLRDGAPGDVVVIDADVQWTVDKAKFRSHCGSTPLAGCNLYGRVTHTFVAGRLLYQLDGAS